MIIERDKIYWWAYLHSNGTIQIKRFFPVSQGQDDLEYAKEEQLNGNDFLDVIMPEAFAAATREEATEIAYKYFSSCCQKGAL